jgi:hypothetical protein
LPEADQEAIRQVMLKQTVRIVKHQLPNESGTTCHAIAWDLVEKALKAERAKGAKNGKADSTDA